MASKKPALQKDKIKNNHPDKSSQNSAEMTHHVLGELVQLLYNIPEDKIKESLDIQKKLGRKLGTVVMELMRWHPSIWTMV